MTVTVQKEDIYLYIVKRGPVSVGRYAKAMNEIVDMREIRGPAVGGKSVVIVSRTVMRC